MQTIASDNPQLADFRQAFSSVMAQPLDLEEFAADDLYAFRVLERALLSHSASLRNLAEHLLVLRADVTESITIKPLNALNETSRMTVLAAREATPSGPRPAPSVPPEDTPERRLKEGRFSPQQSKVLAQYKTLYTETFGDTFDIDEFATNDQYGRAVLLRTLTAANPTLVRIAQYFIDENGNPGRHRRNARKEPDAA